MADMRVISRSSAVAQAKIDCEIFLLGMLLHKNCQKMSNFHVTNACLVLYTSHSTSSAILILLLNTEHIFQVSKTYEFLLIMDARSA